MTSRPERAVVGATALLALFSAGMWLAWLGWDRSYYQVDGVAQGPYRAWQVIGCCVSIGAATVVAYLRARRTAPTTLLAVAPAGGFALPWAIDAARDETGTWVIGLLGILIGGFAAQMVVLLVTEAITDRTVSPAPALTSCGVAALIAVMLYPLAAIIPVLGGLWVVATRVTTRRARPDHSTSRN